MRGGGCTRQWTRLASRTRRVRPAAGRGCVRVRRAAPRRSAGPSPRSRRQCFAEQQPLEHSRGDGAKHYIQQESKTRMTTSEIYVTSLLYIEPNLNIMYTIRLKKKLII